MRAGMLVMSSLTDYYCFITNLNKRKFQNIYAYQIKTPHLLLFAFNFAFSNWTTANRIWTVHLFIICDTMYDEFFDAQHLRFICRFSWKGLWSLHCSTIGLFTGFYRKNDKSFLFDFFKKKKRSGYCNAQLLTSG